MEGGKGNKTHTNKYNRTQCNMLKTQLLLINEIEEHYRIQIGKNGGGYMYRERWKLDTFTKDITRGQKNGIPT